MKNTNLEDVMNALESMDDQQLAVKLLKEFNDASAKWGTLMMNKDPNLDSNSWKKEVDSAQKKLDSILGKILA